MTLTPCAPCECIQANIGVQKFHQDVEIILCGILSGVGGSTPLDNTFLASTAAGTAGSTGSGDFTTYRNQVASLSVIPNAGASAWTVILEVSQDGSTWFPASTITQADGASGFLKSISGMAVAHARYHVTVATGGSLKVALRGAWN